MPVSNIKYKLIAHHGLKSDTFKEFMIYVFNNFSESEAKKMCNSFIGELGRKYNRTDMKKRDKFNMMEFKIKTINENEEDNLEFEIDNETFSLNEFRESFLPNFCNTVYKYQGGKIGKHYNIFDRHKMDVKEMYTELSRITKLEYIHLDRKKICSRYLEREQDNMIILNSYFNADHQNGKIYEVTFELNYKYYVGSTTQLLEDRLNEHQNNKKVPYTNIVMINPKSD